jgi:hypothetical protein
MMGMISSLSKRYPVALPSVTGHVLKKSLWPLFGAGSSQSTIAITLSLITTHIGKVSAFLCARFNQHSV